MNLLQTAKTELFRSNADLEHPFRLMYLATQDVYPEIRTVVKRNIEEDLSIVFYTDSRSPKVQQIHNHPQVSLLFYHPGKQLQVRMRGRAETLTDGPAYETSIQKVMQSAGIKDYASKQAPGSLLQEGTSFSPGEEIHFAVVRVHPQQIDVLQLNRERHLRSLYHRDNGQWLETPLVP